MANLLGKPQTIRNIYTGSFDLGREEIENVFHLVDQRVTQQNEASLVQFIVLISYDDRSSVLLNSLEDFVRYREVRPVIATIVQLTWIYLIKFQQSEVPEKQTIELSMHALSSGQRFIDAETMIISNDVFPSGIPTGRFVLRIQHTARSWGTDIENLIAGQIKGWTKREPTFIRMIYTYSTYIGFAFGIMFFALLFAGLYFASQPGIEGFKKSAATALASAVNEDKLNFIIGAVLHNPLYDRTWWQYFIGVGGGIASVFVGVLVGSLSNNGPKSFLVLSDGSKKYREEALRERKWSWGYFVGSAICVHGGRG